MMRELLLAFLVFLVASCTSDRNVGQRYRAERELRRAEWAFEDLSNRPQDVKKDQWVALAGKLEAIAGRYTSPSNGALGTRAQEDVQTIAARALFDAARLHAMLGDSILVNKIYQQMAQDFEHLPEVAAEVALARGQISESKGQLVQAIEFYQYVVDHIEPDPKAMGIASSVLDLPLHIARLRVKSTRPSSLAEYYVAAQAYYWRLVRDHDGELLQFESQARLAEIAADLGEWRKAAGTLRLLEAALRKLDKPLREPAAVRFAIAGIQTRGGADPDSVRLTLTSLLKDYPKCDLAPQVLMALAKNANDRNQVDEALGYLDQIVQSHKKDEQVAPQALLTRGRLLESHDRWPEALAAFRAVAAEHPISEAALRAPLEIVQHYSRVGDADGAKTALGQAENEYRSFVVRYPPGPLSVFARQLLIQTLSLQKNYDSAITEMVNLGEEQPGTSGGATLLLGAARMAYTDLADTARAASILERTSELYAKADIGNWAAKEAARLRGTMLR